MTMLAYFIRHRLAANILMMGLLVSGLITSWQMPTKLLPDVEFPFVSFSVNWQGATAEIIVDELATPLSERIEQRSATQWTFASASDGSLWLGVLYDLDADMDRELDELQKVLNGFEWPEGIAPPQAVQDQIRETVGMVFISQPGDINALRSLATRAQDELMQRGLADVAIWGLPSANLSWEPTLDTWLSLQQSPSEVLQSLQMQTQRRGLGSVGEQTLELGSRPGQGAELGELQLHNTPLAQLARLSDGPVRPPELIVGDNPAVILNIQRAPSMGTVEAGDIIRDWMEDFAERQSDQVYLSSFLDPVDLVEGHLQLLTNNALLGLLLVLATLFVLLNSRVAFWTAAGIPVAVIGTMALLYVFDGSLSMFSIFAMLIALGIVVDDAIVVSEQTLSLKQQGMSATEAAIAGARRMFTPVMAAALTTMAAFTPLLFLPGAFGELLRPIPLVIICVLLASLFECFFILPGHLNHSLSKGEQETPGKLRVRVDGAFARLRDHHFRRFITWVIHHRLITLSLAGSFLALSITLIVSESVSFSADLEVESNQIQLSASFYPDTTDTEQQSVTQDILAAMEMLEVHHAPLIKQHIVHQQLDSRQLTIYTELHDGNTRSLSNLEVVQQWKALIPPSVAIEAVTSSEDPSVNDRGGLTSNQVQFRLVGEDIEAVQAALEAVKAALQQVPYLSQVRDDFPERVNQIRITPNALARQLGMDEVFLQNQLNGWLSSQKVMELSRGGTTSEFRVGVDADDMKRLDFVSRIPVRAPDGRYYTLAQLTEQQRQLAPQSIKLWQGEASTNIAAQLNDDEREAHEVQDELQASLVEPIAMRFGVRTEYSGSTNELKALIEALKISVPIALLLIYLVLAWVFQSWLWPSAVVAAIPFAMTGAIVGHWLMGMDFTIMSILGLFGVSGIVVNDAIILIDRFRQCLAESPDKEQAIIEAACQRFRAVILTSITTVIGLLPILFERSIEAQILKTMAISLAFGLAYGTLVVLVVTPCLMTLVRRRKSIPAPVESETAVSNIEPLPKVPEVAVGSQMIG